MAAPTTGISGEACTNLAFVAGGALLGLAWAWLAAIVQDHWAPVLLFPILTGAMLGLGLRLLARGWPGLRRSTILAATLMGGLVLIGGQHGFAYRQYRAGYEQSRSSNPQAQLVELAFGDQKPLSFGEFLKYSARERSFGSWQVRGWQVWVSWVVDGALTLAGAVGSAWMRPRE
jgi:hypothetical protein